MAKDTLPTHKGLADELRVIASWLNGIHARKVAELADKVDPDVDTTPAPAPANEANAAPEAAQ